MAVENYYNKTAGTYNKRIKNYVKYNPNPFLKDILNIIPKNKKLKIIDIGCGTGLSSKDLIKKGHEVIGIDASPKMMEFAKKYKFKELIVQDLDSKLKLRKNNFDLAIMVGVLDYLKKPFLLLKRTNKIIKMQGHFFLTIPHKLDTKSRNKIFINNYYPQEIEPIIEKSGFRIITREQIFGHYWVEDKNHHVDFLKYHLQKIQKPKLSIFSNLFVESIRKNKEDLKNNINKNIGKIGIRLKKKYPKLYTQLKNNGFKTS